MKIVIKLTHPSCISSVSMSFSYHISKFKYRQFHYLLGLLLAIGDATFSIFTASFPSLNSGSSFSSMIFSSFRSRIKWWKDFEDLKLLIFIKNILGKWYPQWLIIFPLPNNPFEQNDWKKKFKYILPLKYNC